MLLFYLCVKIEKGFDVQRAFEATLAGALSQKITLYIFHVEQTITTRTEIKIVSTLIF